MPKKIGKYILQSTLGEGAFGKVKKARLQQTGQIFAIKIIKKQKIIEEGLLNAVKSEIINLISCDHKHIVRLYEVFSSRTKLYMVMQFIEGVSLIDHISNNNPKSDTIHPNEQQAKIYFLQLCQAMQYLKNKNIAHRDIKLENIIIDSKGQLKLLDFGLSVLLKNTNLFEAEMQTQCGTLQYLAPQILKKQKYDPFASDIWSLGVVLYCLVHGSSPFQSQNISTLMNKILNSDLKLSSKLSIELRHLLRSILQVNPQKRLTLKEIINHAWMKKNLEIVKINESSKYNNEKPQYHTEGQLVCRKIQLFEFIFLMFHIGIHKMIDQNKICFTIKNVSLFRIFNQLKAISKSTIAIEKPNFKTYLIWKDIQIKLEVFALKIGLLLIEIESKFPQILIDFKTQFTQLCN